MPVPRTIADGQALTTPGALTFEVNRLLADAVETVTDDEIRTAMVFAFERLKTVLEPSGATGLAALLAGRLGPLPPRVGVILSGGTCPWSGSRSCAPAEAARTRLRPAPVRTARASCAVGGGGPPRPQSCSMT